MAAAQGPPTLNDTAYDSFCRILAYLRDAMRASCSLLVPVHTILPAAAAARAAAGRAGGVLPAEHACAPRCEGPGIRSGCRQQHCERQHTAETPPHRHAPEWKMRAVDLGSRMRMMTAAKRLGLYSALRACSAMFFRSSLHSRLTVATTFWGRAGGGGGGLQRGRRRERAQGRARQQAAGGRASAAAVAPPVSPRTAWGVDAGAVPSEHWRVQGRRRRQGHRRRRRRRPSLPAGAAPHLQLRHDARWVHREVHLGLLRLRGHHSAGPRLGGRHPGRCGARRCLLLPQPGCAVP